MRASGLQLWWAEWQSDKATRAPEIRAGDLVLLEHARPNEPPRVEQTVVAVAFDPGPQVAASAKVIGVALLLILSSEPLEEVEQSATRSVWHVEVPRAEP